MSNSKSSVGRRLMGAPVLWQDWEQEAEESAAGYWELFTDLLMVAAATSMAEGLEENPSWEGLYEFALLYVSIASGWILYTHHYCSRFEESSLLHSVALFFYLLGMAACIVNAGFETARDFSLGVVLQRSAFLFMLVFVGVYLPRARPFATVLGGVTAAVVVCYATTALWPSWAKAAWTVAALIDYSLPFFLIYSLPGTKLVPVNIEHSKDRLGVLVLVMMGETVISSTITYREYAKDKTVADGEAFYTVMALSFLLVFMFTLLFFNMQPAPKDHAFRRSRLVATCCLLLNKTLGLSLLAVGYCVKEAVHVVVARQEQQEEEGEEEEEQGLLSVFSARLLGLAVGCSMLLLFGMRCCHYAGKLPRPTDPPNIRRLMWIWWWGLGIASIIPFFLVGMRRAVASLAMYSGLLMIVCVVESCFSHALQEHLPNEETAPLYCDRSVPTYQAAKCAAPLEKRSST